MRKVTNKGSLSSAAFSKIASEFKVLADETRLRILNHLRTGEGTVTEVVKATAASQSNISKHLALLHRAGFVRRRKSGQRVFYSISDPTVLEVCELMCSKFRNHFEDSPHEKAD